MTRLCGCFLLAAAAALAQSVAVVEGRVTDATTGLPVRQATVVFQGLDATGNPPQPDSYVVETGADGRFRAADVAPGRYEARAQCAGFLPANPRSGTRLTVPAGESTLEVALRLVRTGVVTGRVSDSDGDPISRASVELLRYSYAEGRKALTPVARIVTDDRGQYRLYGLAPGRYYLRVSQGRRLVGLSTMFLQMQGTPPANAFATTFYPGVRDQAAAATLDVQPGGELQGIDVWLKPEAFFAIRGTIAGAPVRAHMWIKPISGEAQFAQSTDLDSGGGFEFPHLLPGSYLVEGADEFQRLGCRQVVTVVDRDVEGLTLTLLPALTVTGVVHTEDGAPVALDAVRVTLETASSETASAVVQTDGRFALPGVMPDQYDIRVTAPPGGYLKSVRVGGRELSSPRVDLAGSAGALAIAIGGDGGKIDGTVWDARGEAAEGAQVVLVPDGRLRDWPDLVRSAVAATGGKFALRDIAPGDYRLFAFDDAERGAPLDPDFRKPFEGRATAIHVEASGKQTIRVKAM